MQRFRSAVLVLALAVASTAPAQSKAAAERWVGSWKLNLAKSKYQFGALPKSRTLKFEAVSGGVKVTSNLTDDQGPVHIEFTAGYDGKDAVMYGPTPGVTIAVRRIDANTLQTAQKSRGTVSITTRFVVSADGKTMIATATGDSPQGHFSNVSIYERIP